MDSEGVGLGGGGGKVHSPWTILPSFRVVILTILRTSSVTVDTMMRQETFCCFFALSDVNLMN